MKYNNKSKKTLLTPAQSYPMILGCFGANLSRCVHFEHKKRNKTELDRLEFSSELQRFFQLFRPLFNQCFKVVGVFVVVFCLIKLSAILFNGTRRFRTKFTNFVWLWGMMYVISLGTWSNRAFFRVRPWTYCMSSFGFHFHSEFVLFFIFLSHTFLVDSLVEMTCLTASPFRSNAAGPWW